MRILLTALLLCGASAGLAPAQHIAVPESVSVAAGAQYGISGPLGWLQRWLFGSRYRRIWATPVRSAVLDLHTSDAGLTPIGADTGLRAGYLYLRGADGSAYTFRAANLDLSPLLPRSMQKQVMTGVLQDLLSARNPAAPFVVPVLAEGTGARARRSVFFVLREDSALRQLRPSFRGGAGWLRPGIDTRYRATAGGDDSAISSDQLLARLRRPHAAPVDTRAYLTERLLDLYVGAWDPLPQDWLWTKDSAGTWTPLPRDRDQAFVRFDGLVTAMVGAELPEFATFSAKYDPKLALTSRERILDRRLLGELDWSAWEAAALALQARLSDSLIDAAARAMPPEYYAVGGPRMSDVLRRRRDRLPEAARRYYRAVVENVDIYGTEGSDTVTVDRPADGVLDVRIGSGFRRRLLSGETDAVRLYLLGGEDQLAIGGSGRHAPKLEIHRLAGEEPLFVDTVPREPLPLRGHRNSIVPWLNFNSDIGLLVGAAIVATDFDYGYDPFQRRIRLRAGFATRPSDFAVELRTERRYRASPVRLVLDARASGIEVLKFFGYGNETPRSQDLDYYRTGQRLFLLAPSLSVAVGSRARFEAGPVIKYVTTRQDTSLYITQIMPYGTDGFGQIGAQASVVLDRRDARSFARHGVFLTAGASGYPGVWSAVQAFGEVHAAASTYVTPFSAFTLAVRAAGKKIWGAYPVHEAAFVGGSKVLRSLPPNRYAGDAAVYGNLNAMLRMATFPFIMRWDYGLLGIADVGRVFLEGETSRRWHAGFGGGFWAALPDRSFTGLFDVVKGDEGVAFWFGTGFIF